MVRRGQSLVVRFRDPVTVRHRLRMPACDADVSSSGFLGAESWTDLSILHRARPSREHARNSCPNRWPPSRRSAKACSPTAHCRPEQTTDRRGGRARHAVPLLYTRPHRCGHEKWRDWTGDHGGNLGRGRNASGCRVCPFSAGARHDRSATGSRGDTRCPRLLTGYWQSTSR